MVVVGASGNIAAPEIETCGHRCLCVLFCGLLTHPMCSDSIDADAQIEHRLFSYLPNAGYYRHQLHNLPR